MCNALGFWAKDEQNSPDSESEVSEYDSDIGSKSSTDSDSSYEPTSAWTTEIEQRASGEALAVATLVKKVRSLVKKFKKGSTRTQAKEARGEGKVPRFKLDVKTRCV